MKVYATTVENGEVVLKTWKSKKSFLLDNNNSWINHDLIHVVTTDEIKNYDELPVSPDEIKKYDELPPDEHRIKRFIIRLTPNEYKSKCLIHEVYLNSKFAKTGSL